MNGCLNSKLRRWREASGLSLREVADLTGLSVPMVSRVERGQRQLAPLTKAAFARRLGVPIADLFDIDPIAEVEDVSA
jgi:transcriptional regulator with XRE-family HTH domain